MRVLPLMFPGLVILDGGPDNKDCDSVVAGVVALRRVSGKKLPAVILLSNRTGDPESLSLGGAVDAVVTKPFTTDQLQPVVDRLMQKAKGARHSTCGHVLSLAWIIRHPFPSFARPGYSRKSATSIR